MGGRIPPPQLTSPNELAGLPRPTICKPPQEFSPDNVEIGIRKETTWLNSVGLTTKASCEGHANGKDRPEAFIIFKGKLAYDIMWKIATSVAMPCAHDPIRPRFFCISSKPQRVGKNGLYWFIKPLKKSYLSFMFVPRRRISAVYINTYHGEALVGGRKLLVDPMFRFIRLTGKKVTTRDIDLARYEAFSFLLPEIHKLLIYSAAGGRYNKSL